VEVEGGAGVMGVRKASIQSALPTRAPKTLHPPQVTSDRRISKASEVQSRRTNQAPLPPPLRLQERGPGGEASSLRLSQYNPQTAKAKMDSSPGTP
jgi:hypothetical protein